MNEKNNLEQKVLQKAFEYAGEYLTGVDEKNAFPSESELKNLKKFDEKLPEGACDPLATLKFLHENGSAGTVSSNGAKYFGFVIGSVCESALGARLLGDVWNQNAVSDVASPVCAKIEEVVEGWLPELFGLPGKYAASFVSGTSTGHLVALVTARNKIYERVGFDVKKRGLFDAPKIRIVASKEAHVTLAKAISILGFGSDNVELVDCDLQGRMKAEDLPQLDEFCIVCTQAGNLNSGSFDFFEEIGKKAKEAKALMYVDGAFGLWAGACETKKYLIKGLQYADFLTSDGHKTLNSSYDGAFTLIKEEHVEALKSAMACGNVSVEKQTKTQSKDITLDFSKRARALEIWAVIRSLGKGGISDAVHELCENAQYFAEGLKKAGYEIVNDVVFNQIVAKIGSDEQLAEILKRVQDSGVCWFSSTNWQGVNAFRISVSSFKTRKSDIDECLKLIEKVTKDVIK